MRRALVSLSVSLFFSFPVLSDSFSANCFGFVKSIGQVRQDELKAWIDTSEVDVTFGESIEKMRELRVLGTGDALKAMKELTVGIKSSQLDSLYRLADMKEGSAGLVGLHLSGREQVEDFLDLWLASSSRYEAAIRRLPSLGTHLSILANLFWLGGAGVAGYAAAASSFSPALSTFAGATIFYALKEKLPSLFRELRSMLPSFGLSFAPKLKEFLNRSEGAEWIYLKEERKLSLDLLNSNLDARAVARQVSYDNSPQRTPISFDSSEAAFKQVSMHVFVRQRAETPVELVAFFVHEY